MIWEKVRKGLRNSTHYRKHLIHILRITKIVTNTKKLLMAFVILIKLLTVLGGIFHK